MLLQTINTAALSYMTTSWNDCDNVLVHLQCDSGWFAPSGATACSTVSKQLIGSECILFEKVQ
jgi:hypothetical protein